VRKHHLLFVIFSHSFLIRRTVIYYQLSMYTVIGMSPIIPSLLLAQNSPVSISPAVLLLLFLLCSLPVFQLITPHFHSSLIFEQPG
jgi:hypothetical protein